MPKTVVWHGTPDEARNLSVAIAHNCECKFAMGIRVTTCPPHHGVTEDQRWCDWLVFMRRFPPDEGLDGESET